MTGYATLEHAVQNGNLVIELKAVNSRYLDLQFKLDDTLKSQESALRDAIKDKIARGKVECKFYLASKTVQDSQASLNEEVLMQLKQLSSVIKEHFPHSAALTTNEILHWPNIIMQSQHVDQIEITEVVSTLIHQALDELNAARLREGEKLKAIILDRLRLVEALVDKVKPLMTDLVATYQAKLTSKLQEAIQTMDKDRVNQEVVLFSQKFDIDEELSRLTTHIAEVRRMLNSHGPVGKRLDFMMQELNREANTLGSKSVAIETTQVAMELKVLIEQMREQIQNIE